MGHLGRRDLHGFRDRHHFLAIHEEPYPLRAGSEEAPLVAHPIRQRFFGHGVEAHLQALAHHHPAHRAGPFRLAS